MRICTFCKKKFPKGSNGHLFRIPKDSGKREKWNRICGTNFSANNFLCSDHFLPTSIIWSAGKVQLMPSAEPYVPKMDSSSMDISNTGYRTKSNRNIIQSSKTQPLFVEEDQVEIIEEIDKEYGNLTENNNFVAPKYSNAELKESFLNLNEDITPPQLQEPIVQIPINKSISCTLATQTNTRLCGLVQASGYSHELRLNCFYCSEVFPLETWKMFVNHIKHKHFEREEAFKMFEYVSNDHDYTPINLPSPNEKIVIKTEPPILEDPLQTVHNSPETFSSTFFYGSDEYKTNILNNFIETSSSIIPTPVSETTSNELTFYSMNNSKSENISERTLQETPLSRCLKRTDSIEIEDPQEEEKCGTVSPEIIQQNYTEITFEYSPEDMVDLLLDSMKNYNVLWEFHNEPDNQDFYEAVEDICKIINDKWSLNIDNLKMRRSINRILRYYCYLYPNSNVENIDKFTNYYDKCATFLPSSIHEITYARCSHCYICFKNDFNLKQHLLEEYKYLQWPFKCVHCKECFRESDEFELHKRLPHYREIFRCETCNRRFTRRNIYNRHVLVDHRKDKKYKCNICGKLYQSKRGLNIHLLTHGEKKVKCHLCPSKFFEKSSLTKHLKIHKGQYDYVCEVCGKAFLFPNALLIHMKTHTGVKVSCNICNLKLRSSSLKRHLRLMHNGYSDKTSETDMSYIYRKVVKTGRVRAQRKADKNYRCKICNIYFNNYKLIVEHNKELHFDKPKCPCKMCFKEFAQASNLKTHYRTKHNLHAIQAYKLVNEKEDLDVVLNIKPEFLNAITENLRALRNKPTEVTQTESKSNLLSEETYLEIEPIHSSTIQDEIMQAADNIASQESKIDMDDFLTDILK